LGLVLSKTAYNDFAKIAFEAGINVNPGNKDLLHNYLLFLLEIKQFDKFNTVFNHAKRVLDQSELSNIQRI
jgi:Tfp pilus assembly protein PilF